MAADEHIDGSAQPEGLERQRATEPAAGVVNNNERLDEQSPSSEYAAADQTLPPDIQEQPPKKQEALPVASADDEPSMPDAEQKPPSRADIDSVEWQAPEYVHHDKGTLWFVGLGIVTIVGAALAFIFGQWLFAVLIVVMGLALGVLAKRPPRDVHYLITNDSVTIGGKVFRFNQFKSFGILNEGDIYAGLLRPAKRFMPSVTVYFRHEDGERIFDALAANLPMEEIKPDVFDKFMKRLRF